MNDLGKNNVIEIPDTITVAGEIKGDNNVVRIGESLKLDIRINISGSNNRIVIGRRLIAKRLIITVGNHAPANNAVVEIGDYCSAESDCRFYVYNSGNSLRIGNECMFSNSIVLRTGESPHLIFDDLTGEYLDTEGNVEIGDHCWIGEGAYITKRAGLPRDTIVAARAVVTRQFDEEMTMIAGNPAVIKKRNIRWVRNKNRLVEGSRFKQSHDAFLKQHEV